jgi:hypothetical protein
VQINIILVDPLECVQVKTLPADIRKNLQDYFNQVAVVANASNPRPNPLHTVTETWSKTKPSPKDTDVLIYFVPREISIVWKFAGGARTSPDAVRHWGRTPVKWERDKNVVTNRAASEVYAKELDAGTLAALAFHEAMHHKLMQGNEMHGPVGDRSLAARQVDGQSQLTNANKVAMAGALTKRIQQWTDGFDLLATAKILRDQGDPLWDLSIN